MAVINGTSTGQNPSDAQENAVTTSPKMDISALINWFIVVGVLASLALILWCVNIFIFKGHQIVGFFKKYMSQTATGERVRRGSRDQKPSRRLGAVGKASLTSNKHFANPMMNSFALQRQGSPDSQDILDENT